MITTKPHEAWTRELTPYNKMPPKGRRLPENRSGNLTGRITVSFSDRFANSRPATSSHLMSGFFVRMMSESFPCSFLSSASASLLSERAQQTQEKSSKCLQRIVQATGSLQMFRRTNHPHRHQHQLVQQQPFYPPLSDHSSPA